MKKIFMILLLVEIAIGGYIPIPALTPMGDFTVYQNQTVQGSFTIEDPNGPVGLTITTTPSGLVIEEPNITTIANYPEAHKYVYSFKYQPVSVGLKTFNIKAVDSLGVEVNQQIIFDVKGNAVHVFTGCRVN